MRMYLCMPMYAASRTPPVDDMRPYDSTGRVTAGAFSTAFKPNVLQVKRLVREGNGHRTIPLTKQRSKAQLSGLSLIENPLLSLSRPQWNGSFFLTAFSNTRDHCIELQVGLQRRNASC